MKQLRILAVLLTILLLCACGTKTPGNTPDPTPAVSAENGETPSADTPEAPINDAMPNIPNENETETNIPTAATTKEPTKEGETYKAAGMYIGMADNNLMVIIEANPEDGKPEKSYQISPEIDLEAMGITEGSLIDLEYTVDENGIKRVKSVSVKH